MRATVIHLHPAAPVKPPEGQACNGCGVCCAWQPCPMGMLISGRREGACAALQWSAADARYRCGVLGDPASLWPRLPAPLQPPLQALAKRWISAGSGCDCNAEV